MLVLGKIQQHSVFGKREQELGFSHFGALFSQKSKTRKKGSRNNREAENSQPWARNPIVFSPVRA